MKNNHTATPWKIDSNGIITGGPYNCTSIGSICTWKDKNDAEVFNSRAKAAHVVLEGYQGGMVDEAKGNAEFICLAVNAHDELVEALKTYITEWCDRSQNTHEMEPECLKLARVTLAKAKGGSK